MGGDTLEQVVQGGCGCPIPGGIQGQAGCGSGQPALVVGDPARSRGLELDEHCGPFQPRPFYDSLMRQPALIPFVADYRLSLPLLTVKQILNERLIYYPRMNVSIICL